VLVLLFYFAMRTVALMLTCWATAGGGRRLHTTGGRLQVGSDANHPQFWEFSTRVSAPNPLDALASLLSAVNPMSGWQVPGTGPAGGKHLSSSAGIQRRLPSHFNALPLMVDNVVNATVPEIDFDSPRWEKLQKHLDTLPVFRVVEGENMNPMGYEQDGKQLDIFFVESLRAQQEVDVLSKKFPGQALQLQAVGLGAAFRAHMEGTALVVPSADALERSPDSFSSETTPLYTCLSMRSKSVEGDGLDLQPGTLTVPLFMNPKDADASLQASKVEAIKAGLDAKAISKLQLTVCAMPVAVSLIIQGKEDETIAGNKFQFVASRNSLELLRSMMEGGAFGENANKVALENLGKRPQGSNPNLFGE